MRRWGRMILMIGLVAYAILMAPIVLLAWGYLAIRDRIGWRWVAREHCPAIRPPIHE